MLLRNVCWITARFYTPEDTILHNHRRGNVKYIFDVKYMSIFIMCVSRGEEKFVVGFRIQRNKISQITV